LAANPIAERLAILERNEGWFGQAPSEFRKALLANCEWRECPAGQTVYHAVDQFADLLGIVEGTVEVYSRFAGAENPLLHLLHEGAWLGYGSQLSDRLRVTVVARVDTLLARIPRWTVAEMLESRPEWWRVLAAAALEYGDVAVRGLADQLIPDSGRRCAAMLLRLAGQRDPRRTLVERTAVPITQDELAGLVNVSRTTLVRLLRGLEHRRLVVQEYRAVRIVDVPGLESVAAGH
jgi:CRP-like cAMP-binding protein